MAASEVAVRAFRALSETLKASNEARRLAPPPRRPEHKRGIAASEIEVSETIGNDLVEQHDPAGALRHGGLLDGGALDLGGIATQGLEVFDPRLAGRR